MDLTIVTPAVHRDSGTEKCMSWLIEDLTRSQNVTLMTGTLRDTDTSRLRRIRKIIEIKRPRLVRYLDFLYASTARLLFSRKPGIILSTSGDCWNANVIYAHFCCAAWLEMISRGEVTLPTGTPWHTLRNLHYRLFLRVAAWHEKRMYHRSSVQAIVAVSSQVKQEIIDNYGVAESLIRVIPNAADESVRLKFSERAKLRHRVRHRLDIGPQACVFLFIAAGDWKRKGLDLALQAMAQMQDRSSKLIVTGDEDIAHYRDRARHHKIADRVIFTGPARNIAEIYAAADVFVYPSLYEAFPLVLLEAAAAGLALVVTPMGGVAELNADGESAAVVERSSAAIAAVMGDLAANVGKREQLGKRAAAASAKFTRQSVADAFTGVLEKIAR